MMINQIQDMGSVLAAFFEKIPKKDHQGIFKMFAPDAFVTDFEDNTHRTASINNFFRDWPPRTMTLKVEKQQIVDRMATVSVVLTGGAFVKPQPAKLIISCNDKWQIRTLKMTIGG